MALNAKWRLLDFNVLIDIYFSEKMTAKRPPSQGSSGSNRGSTPTPVSNKNKKPSDDVIIVLDD